MSPPNQINWNELLRKFHVLGWVGPVYGTKHPYMEKGKQKQHIPNPHHQQSISKALLSRILKQAGITEEEWDNA